VLLDDLGRRLLAGGDPITFDEALAVAELPDSEVPALIALAHRVRLQLLLPVPALALAAAAGAVHRPR
jgi:hypothetical protein